MMERAGDSTDKKIEVSRDDLERILDWIIEYDTVVKHFAVGDYSSARLSMPYYFCNGTARGRKINSYAALRAAAIDGDCRTDDYIAVRDRMNLLLF